MRSQAAGARFAQQQKRCEKAEKGRVKGASNLFTPSRLSPAALLLSYSYKYMVVCCQVLLEHINIIPSTDRRVLFLLPGTYSYERTSTPAAFIYTENGVGNHSTAAAAHSTHLPVVDSSDTSCRGVAPGRVGAPREVLSVVVRGPRAVVGSHLSAASAGGAPSQRPGAMLASVPVNHAKQLRLVQAHFLSGVLSVFGGGAVAD